jgi:hypothetical protein
MTTKHKFGTIGFFKKYLDGQIERQPEANRQEVLHRVHFSMSCLILDEFKGKEALIMLKNLNVVCEEVSVKLAKVSQIQYEL